MSNTVHVSRTPTTTCTTRPQKPVGKKKTCTRCPSSVIFVDLNFRRFAGCALLRCTCTCAHVAAVHTLIGTTQHILHVCISHERVFAVSCVAMRSDRAPPKGANCLCLFSCTYLLVCLRSATPDVLLATGLALFSTSRLLQGL